MSCLSQDCSHFSLLTAVNQSRRNDGVRVPVMDAAVPVRSKSSKTEGVGVGRGGWGRSGHGTVREGYVGTGGMGIR